MRKLIWVDPNDMRPGARPILYTEPEYAEERTVVNESTMRTAHLEILGPSWLRFDPDNTGLARVWIETDADVVALDPRPFAV